MELDPGSFVGRLHRFPVSERNISSQGKDEEASNLQALIPEALRVDGLAFDNQLDTFKGKDRYDTGGSLQSGEASGRVDVPVSVGVLLSSEEICSSSQYVALVTPGSCVAKTIFVEGGGWKHGGTPGQGAHCCGRLAGLHGGCVGHVQWEEGAVDGSDVVHNVIGNHQLTFLASGRAWRADKKRFDL